MLDCKHAGPSLPPTLFSWQRAQTTQQAGEQEAEKAIGRAGTKVAQVLGGERDPGTQCPAEHTWAGLVLDRTGPQLRILQHINPQS